MFSFWFYSALRQQKSGSVRPWCRWGQVTSSHLTKPWMKNTFCMNNSFIRFAYVKYIVHSVCFAYMKPQVVHLDEIKEEITLIRFDPNIQAFDTFILNQMHTQINHVYGVFARREHDKMLEITKIFFPASSLYIYNRICCSPESCWPGTLWSHTVLGTEG